MAFQALAARTGTVIADERTRLTIRTALDGDDLGRRPAATPATTVVVYKGGRRLPELAAETAACGRGRATAVAGELIGMPGERIGQPREAGRRRPGVLPGDGHRARAGTGAR